MVVDVVVEIVVMDIELVEILRYIVSESENPDLKFAVLESD